jgi:LmbE family N-acetylglucosaminyl deacetylase
MRGGEHPECDRAPARRVAVVCAHPDDETLWAGGTILMHPEWDVFVACLCRASDPDRAPKFGRVLERLGAEGAMADVDDGPGQDPLPAGVVEETVLGLLPDRWFDLILTHGPRGEYTRHRRHEETSDGVARLWRSGDLEADELRMFAYTDDGGLHLPRARDDAHEKTALPEGIRQAKYDIVTGLYGFGPDSFEARTTPREEAFWRFGSPAELDAWLAAQG